MFFCFSLLNSKITYILYLIINDGNIPGKAGSTGKIKILLSIKKTKVSSKSNKAAKLFFTQMIGN
jgi:hypothetical protein